MRIASLGTRVRVSTRRPPRSCPAAVTRDLLVGASLPAARARRARSAASAEHAADCSILRAMPSSAESGRAPPPPPPPRSPGFFSFLEVLVSSSRMCSRGPLVSQLVPSRPPIAGPTLAGPREPSPSRCPRCRSPGVLFRRLFRTSGEWRRLVPWGGGKGGGAIHVDQRATWRRSGSIRSRPCRCMGRRGSPRCRARGGPPRRSLARQAPESSPA